MTFETGSVHTATASRRITLSLAVATLVLATTSLPAQKTPIRHPQTPEVPEDTIASPAVITPGTFYDPPAIVVDTLTYDYHRYDPARNGDYPYATTGNLGAPARSMYYAIPKPKGLDIGEHVFDIYQTDFDGFRIYDTNVALTRLNYSQGINQEDAIFSAQFGRTFEKGINFSLNYQRINQKGKFVDQHAKNTALGVGILYRSPKGTLDGIYQYQSNAIIEENNGGVDLLALDTIRVPLNVPVILSSAMTTQRTRAFTVQHHLHVLSAHASGEQPRANIDVIHTLRAESSIVKFADSELLDAETAYYGQFVTDDRGMRSFVSVQTFETGLDVQFRYQTKEIGVPAQMLRAGLQIRSSNVDQEPFHTHVNDLFLNAAGQLGISKHISLDGKGYLGILEASGEYRLDAFARLKLFKDATTWAALNLYQRKPSLTETRFFVNQLPVWENDFRNVALSSLQFHYDQPSIRLRLHGAVHVISNLIYYNSERLPVQLNKSTELLQMSVSKEISFGPVGLQGQVMLQGYDADVIALPHFIFDGQCYYSGRWFQRQLLVRTGIDLMLTDTYHGVSFFPVTGQFYESPDITIAQYPAVDVFFSMQVKDAFRAFIKMENVTAYFSNDHYFQVYGYPQFGRYFRFGLWMKLFD